MTKIAVVGSYNADLSLKVERLPVAGETLLGGKVFESPGGKGSNQAIAVARLGAEVHFICCIGQDDRGNRALALWEREGVYVCARRTEKNPTGSAFIFLLSSGGNAIVVSPGANASLSSDDVSLMEESISGCDFLLVQLEIPVETATHTCKLAKNHGLKVILNPAPVRALPKDAYACVDVLTPNEAEARVLVGKAPDADVSNELVARKLLDLGPQAVVITQGAAGALLVTHADSIHVASPAVKAVDPTGAGDAFNAALAVGLGDGMPMEEAVQWACCAGAYCVTRKHVLPGLGTRQQLASLVQDVEAR